MVSQPMSRVSVRGALRTALVMLVLMPVKVSATEWDPRPNAMDLARRSGRIVVARCLSSQARIVDPGGNIFTFSEFQIIDLVKGSLPPQFTLRILGGTVGATSVSADMSSFEPGEELILFLGPDNQDGYPTVGLQSIYRTRRDLASQQWVVADAIYDLKLFRAGTRNEINQFSTGNYNSPVTVEDFVWSIRQALQPPEEPSRPSREPVQLNE